MGVRGLDQFCPEHEVIVPRIWPRGDVLSEEDRAMNHQISKVRITVENVVCNLNKFRICRAFSWNDPGRHGLLLG